jgi:hypothetical protein
MPTLATEHDFTGSTRLRDTFCCKGSPFLVHTKHAVFVAEKKPRAIP